SLVHDGAQYTLRFSEKGGKSREIPVRHDLEGYLREYIERAAITEGPLFRTAYRKTKVLTKNGMTGGDICRMMKRRLKDAGVSGHFSPHSFRVTTVTDLLEQNVPLDKAPSHCTSGERLSRLSPITYNRRRSAA
ncbi:MAG TPA: tyrosine-type recombinase/integrase, partial [Isosphaeraceae bacterium]|nr:tyrosine-type recombinase/integrase [Isosphaeraceae bacterium]